MHGWMDEVKRERGRGSKKGTMEEGGGDLKVQHSHLDHRAEFAGPQPSHILRNGLQRHLQTSLVSRIRLVLCFNFTLTFGQFE